MIDIASIPHSVAFFGFSFVWAVLHAFAYHAAYKPLFTPILRHGVTRKIAAEKKLKSPKDVPEKEAIAATKRTLRSVWDTIFHLSSALGGMAVMMHWAPLYSAVAYFDGVNVVGSVACGGGELQYAGLEFLNLYNLYLSAVFSFYSYSLWGEARSDNAVMTSHHIATMTLIYLCDQGGFRRIGVAIIVLHDIADVFLELGKTFIYTGRKMLSNICFGGFMLSWFYTRLYVYPVYILHTVWTSAPWAEWPKTIGSAYVFLSALQIMHIWWTIPIVKLFAKIVKGDTEVKDTRE